MQRIARAVPRSLGWRLVLILTGSLIILLGASDWFALKLQRRQMTEMLEERAVGMGETILSSTHFSMLENDRRHLNQILENISRREVVLALRLISAEGQVMYSADSTEIGRMSDVGSEVCQGCHSGGRRHAPANLREGLVLYATPSGQEALGLGVPVLNAPECSSGPCHYHPPDQAVLGILDLELSTSTMDDALGRMRTQAIALAIATVLLISLVIGVLAWRVVHRPLRRVLEGIHRLGAGDLSHRIPGDLPAEAGELSSAFNVMSSRLGAAQEELEEWNRTLETKVREKTGELERTRDQMVFTEKMASLGKLAAIVAHEINNPLAGVLVYAKLVRRRLPGVLGLEKEEGRKKIRDLDDTLGTIEAETGRCGDIVRNLLLFSRQGMLAREPADLNSIVRRASKLVQHRADLGEVRIQLELHPELPEIVCESSEIQQALLALILNALDSMPDGGVLTLRTLLLPGSGKGRIGMDVQDTGVGIPEEVRDRIFEPFFSTKSEGAGTGLGLAVTYGIVQRHGGSIEVESARGAGTTFHLILPLDAPNPNDGTDVSGLQQIASATSVAPDPQPFVHTTPTDGRTP